MSHSIQILESEIDSSINYVIPYNDSSIECRFVQRDPSQIIVYVSSQNGCNKSCRFCWLTQTGQTTMDDVTPELFGLQLQTVLSGSAKKIIDGVRLNVNFMARGEPLANQYILNDWPKIADILLKIAEDYGILRKNVKLNLSTIIPNDINGLASDILQNQPNSWIYWSFYSRQMAFRKRWMPKAANVHKCLEFIGDFPRVVVHSAFIKDENEDLTYLKRMLDEHPQWRMNIVRYNPYSPKQGEESPLIDEITKELEPYSTQVVPRVGFDVKASCGMFVK